MDRSHTFVWEGWLRRRTQATGVRLHDSGIIGVFATQAMAEAEKERDASWVSGTEWECWIRRQSQAIDAKLHDSGIIGVYSTREHAEAEKTRDYAWPQEM